MPSFIRHGLPLTLGLLGVFAACSSNGGGGGSGGFAASGTGGSAASGGSSASGGSGGTINPTGGSGGSIQPDGGGGTGGIDLDSGCAASTVTGTLIPANLLFVIDRSGSMNCNLPSDGQTTAECEAFPTPEDPNKPTKWELTLAALKQAVDDLELSGTNVSLGLDTFPNESTECIVDQTPNVAIQALDPTQNTAFDTYLDAVNPQGKTPLAGATILSYAYLYDQIKQSTLTGNKFVVLLTDGFETCKPEELPKLLAQPNGDVWNAYNLLGIRTFVIGVPGSEDGRALLSQIAHIGGTPKSPTCVHDPAPNNVGDCHFDMTTSTNFGQDLQDALKAISGTVLSCELDMPKPQGSGTPDYDKVTVNINGSDIPAEQSGDCNNVNGWQYAQNKTKILLCGTACDQAKQPNSTVQIFVPCAIQ